MIQNELIDEDLEHFEDVADEDDAYESADAKRNTSTVVNDKNSLPCVDGSASSDSGGHKLDEANESCLEGRKNNLEVSYEVGRDDNEGASKATNLGSTLPGGYDLKKREPLYWYLYFFTHRGN